MITGARLQITDEITREKRKMEIGRKRERLELVKEQINNPRKINSCRGRDK